MYFGADLSTQFINICLLVCKTYATPYSYLHTPTQKKPCEKGLTQKNAHVQYYILRVTRENCAHSVSNINYSWEMYIMVYDVHCASHIQVNVVHNVTALRQSVLLRHS